MHNKVYFTETKPGIFEKNSKFRLKTNWVAKTQYKEVEALGWRIRDRINNAIESMTKTKTAQNMFENKKRKNNPAKPHSCKKHQQTPK